MHNIYIYVLLSKVTKASYHQIIRFWVIENIQFPLNEILIRIMAISSVHLKGEMDYGEILISW